MSFIEYIIGVTETFFRLNTTSTMYYEYLSFSSEQSKETKGKDT